jgi:hypothetical protein
MRSSCIAWAGPAPGRVHGGLLAAANGIQAHPAGRSLAYVAFASWLLTEALGAYMLRSWIVSGDARKRHSRPDGMSLPVLAGHAGLAFTGFLCWITFLVTASPVPAWLALAFLTPAIGLGISTVTVWTPYPAHRGRVARASPAGPQHARGPGELPQGNGGPPGSIPDALLHRALADEKLTAELVDHLLAANLVQPEPPRLDVRALIPVAHGVMAIITFLLGTLAAIGAR